MHKLYANLISALVYDKALRKRVRNLLHGRAQDIPLHSRLLYYINHIECNRIFEKYQGAFRDRELVVMGAGPTLSKYIPIEGAIHIGTNRVIEKDGCLLGPKSQERLLQLDFLFRQDFNGCDDVIYNSKVTKFIGIFPEWWHNLCPESSFIRFKTPTYKFLIETHEDYIPVDIARMPLWHGGSVIFSAFQFALYTHPKRIWLVGCDSAGQNDPMHWHHFNDKPSCQSQCNTIPIKALVDGWSRMKQFQQTMYPDVEVISLNPVGLKGLFQDRVL